MPTSTDAALRGHSTKRVMQDAACFERALLPRDLELFHVDHVSGPTNEASVTRISEKSNQA